MSITEEQFQEWDTKLSGQNFFGGDEPSSEDNEVFKKLDGQEPPSKFLNLWGWYLIVFIFNPATRDSWPAPKQGGAKKGGKKEKKAEAAVEDKKEEVPEAAAEEDDFDAMFGETEEDAELKNAAKEKTKKAAEDAKAKPGVIEKSLILMEVKPWEAGQDLDSLAEKILAIEQDGLLWKTETRQDPIGYGIFKLIVGCTIEDAKVSIDDICEKISTDFESEVQSVDILSFNKC